MSESQFVQAMVEAGLKKFTREVEPDMTRDELRRERNELYTELREEREAKHRLEEKSMTSEREVVIEYVEDNPGCTYKNIADHLAQTAPSRTTNVLEKTEGSDLTVDEDGRWFTR
ncbi:hypothetical protein [Halorubrum sp. Eb13]|uniref:hypothetical protein n=1 Tax=Halorubrum sp. Eb13 TaxID=1383843 RepID=UPI0011402393|nr:hypothetical protein [Halorubrum sp. Eb13]